ncbi:MAG: trehalose-phosphatase [Candidatus Dormibacteria bacterium]
MPGGVDIPAAISLLEGTDPSRWLVAFDFDGTLSPIVARPEDAYLDPALPSLLHRLTSAVGWMAVVSGRNRDFLVGRVPGVMVIGSYGLELPPELSATGLPHGFPAADVRRRLAAAREELEARLPSLPGGRLEVKPWGVALHSRGAGPELDAELADRLAGEVAERNGLVLQRGRMVNDLKPREAVDKGWAIRHLAEALRPSAVVFAGDDLGDGPAWEATRALGVAALTVGIASAELPLDTFAGCDLVLEGQGMVSELLAALLTAAQRAGTSP